MKNWKKYGQAISMILIDYLIDDSNLIKVDEKKLLTIGNDEKFKEAYDYYYEYSNYEFFLFKYDGDTIMLSVYDRNPFKSNNNVMKKLLVLKYVLERIFTNSKLFKTIIRPDNISYHFLINVFDGKILDLNVENFYIGEKQYLTGKELLEFSISDLFLEKKNKIIKLIEKEEIRPKEVIDE
jgi:hypothetical protein